MECARCGRVNRAGARFCGGCGRPLAARCPTCGVESEPDAQFCDACGAALVARGDAGGVARKVVTIVFADLVGSTSLHERLDAEAVRGLMDRYYAALRAAVDAHGGTVVKLLGDGVMAAFGVPRVAEDDAIRGVRAAVQMQRAFRVLVAEPAVAARGVGLRVAVNTGEVVVCEDQTDVVGDPVNVAARLQEQAQDGDVVVGEGTRRLVDHLVTLTPFGALSLKGRSGTVAAYRVVSLERPAGVPATPFVGRDDELARVEVVYAAAVAARHARLAVVLGSPGLGKSRLLAEVARRLAKRATVLTARCDAAGGTTFAPLVVALRALLRLDGGASGDAVRAAIDALLPDDDVERARVGDGVAALCAGTPAAPEETFFVVRRLLAALARDEPVVLAIDDLQWAESLLLDLTEHLVQWTAAPLLVLVAARPELRDVRASLAARGGLVEDVVTLAGLDAGAATRLAASMIGADTLPAAVAGRVLATSEGNPLFLGELVRMLVNDGALAREGERWVAGAALADLEIPPTIHALLAARIERLRPEERAVLERAAVVGRQFSRAAVAHLLGQDVPIDLDGQLEALRRSELIESDSGRSLGEPLLRFHHGLIRDAAYRRLLKGTRAELHGRFADWIESRGEPPAEHDETVGWHLEQAHRLLRELGPLDTHGRDIGDRAARHLAAAGRRALARDDLPLAASLLERALERLDDADPARADMAVDWSEAVLAAGDVTRAARAIDELGRWTGGSDRLRAWHACFAGQRAVLTESAALRATAATLAAAAEALATAGDGAGEAKAHSVRAAALARLGEFGACEVALDRALAAARRAGDRRRAIAVLAGVPQAALWGPSPVTQASGRCLEVVRVLRLGQGAPAVEAVALRCQAMLEALRGRGEAARRLLASSRSMVEELGLMPRLLEADVAAGAIELLEGNAGAAERGLRAAYEGLRAQGLGTDAAQAAALLGRALLAQGRGAEAEAVSHESEALAGDDLKAGIAWRGVRAEALARRGEHAAGIDLARAAVELAAATDALLDHADARLALGAALRAAGRHTDAVAEEGRALQLWDAKAATLLAERARKRLAGRDLGVRARVAESVAALDAAGASPAPAREPSIVPTTTGCIANAATRSWERFGEAWDAGDWGRVAAVFASGFRHLDRRGSGHVDLERDRFLQSLVAIRDMGLSRFACEALATRGARLALARARFGGGSIGASAVEWLTVDEVNEDGARVAQVVFDPGDLDAAYAELDERYAAGEAAASRRAAVTGAFSRAFAARDWDALATLLAPDLVVDDHRRIGWDSLHGPAVYVHVLASLVELVPDVRLRIDHIAMADPGFLYVTTWQGTREGGAFEAPSVIVSELDGLGRISRFDQYDLDQLDDARARLETIRARAARDRSPR